MNNIFYEGDLGDEQPEPKATHEKFCISCNQSGHTYLECKTVNFFGVLAGALGVPDIFRSEVKHDEPLFENERED